MLNLCSKVKFEALSLSLSLTHTHTHTHTFFPSASLPLFGSVLYTDTNFNGQDAQTGKLVFVSLCYTCIVINFYLTGSKSDILYVIISVIVLTVMCAIMLVLLSCCAYYWDRINGQGEEWAKSKQVIKSKLRWTCMIIMETLFEIWVHAYMHTLITVETLNNGHIGGRILILCRGFVPISEMLARHTSQLWGCKVAVRGCDL